MDNEELTELLIRWLEATESIAQDVKTLTLVIVDKLDDDDA